MQLWILIEAKGNCDKHPERLLVEPTRYISLNINRQNSKFYFLQIQYCEMEIVSFLQIKVRYNPHECCLISDNCVSFRYYYGLILKVLFSRGRWHSHKSTQEHFKWYQMCGWQTTLCSLLWVSFWVSYWKFERPAWLEMICSTYTLKWNVR